MFLTLTDLTADMGRMQIHVWRFKSPSSNSISNESYVPNWCWRGVTQIPAGLRYITWALHNWVKVNSWLSLIWKDSDQKIFKNQRSQYYLFERRKISSQFWNIHKYILSFCLLWAKLCSLQTYMLKSVGVENNSSVLLLFWLVKQLKWHKRLTEEKQINLVCTGTPKM